MSWDSERARVILYGGVQGVNFNVYLNDLWDWDGSNWLQRTPTPGPAPSSRYTVCTYDPVHRQMVLFGGHDGNTHVGDTWILEPVFPADVIDTGPGCPGVVGTPTLTATPNSLPWLGDTFVADISGLPALFPSSYMLAGFGNPATPGLFCRPGCTLRTTHEVASFLPTITGQASWSIQVPVNPALLGGSVFAQAVSFDFAAGCTDAMSNGIQVTIGSR